MWQHEIIESLKKSLGSSPFLEYTREVIPLVRNAETFYFGDFSKRKDDHNKRFGGKLGLFIDHIPYDITLVEYMDSDSLDNPEDHTYTSTRRATILNEINNEIHFYSLYYLDSFKRWEVCPVKMVFNLTEYTVSRILLERLYSVAEQKIFHELDTEYSATHYFMFILNGINIVTKTVTPPCRLNKKREKHGKEQLREYRILEVAKGVPRNKHIGNVPWDYRPGNDVAFHMCRGHFKTYSEDAPLFGKYTGTFWWQAQARGSKDSGEIVKDYAVNYDALGQ